MQYFKIIFCTYIETNERCLLFNIRKQLYSIGFLDFEQKLSKNKAD